jgi:hypothetical protein
MALSNQVLDYLLPASGFQFIDFPPPGPSTNSYSVRVNMSDGENMYVYNCRLAAFEL